MKAAIVALFLFIAIVALSNNPNKQRERMYQKLPQWIAMMDDPNCDYFEAMKAFDLFWKNRKKPLEEKEVLGSIAEESVLDDKALSRHWRQDAGESVNFSSSQKIAFGILCGGRVNPRKNWRMVQVN